MSSNHQDIWNQCLSIIREHVLPKIYRTWFEPIKPVSLVDDILTIQVPSSYVYEYLEETHVDLLRSAIRSTIGPKAKLEYQVVVVEDHSNGSTMLVSSVEKGHIGGNSATFPTKPDGTTLINPFAPQTQLEIDPQLNTSFTFDSFVEGECNRVARTAGMSIASNPGKTAFNPLFIHGKSGLGKTHLAQAIGLEIKKNLPKQVVLYVTANIFQTQFTTAQMHNNINDFMHFYQLVDVLIIDDIQEFAGRTATQRTFFHIFNYLHQMNKQLILTSDRSPAELEGMEERMLSRFRWGLQCEIGIPDFSTRLDIVRFRARQDGLDFSEPIMAEIARNVSSVRELQGVMISLLAQSTFNRRELSLDLVREVSGKIVKPHQDELTIELIRDEVCDYFHIPLSLLQGSTRKQEVVKARQLAMFLSKTYTKSSLTQIGQGIGNRDHTTVMYACTTVNNLMETDKGYRIQVEELKKRLGAI